MTEHERITLNLGVPSRSGCNCFSNSNWVSITRYYVSYTSVSFSQTRSVRSVDLLWQSQLSSWSRDQQTNNRLLLLFMDGRDVWFPTPLLVLTLHRTWTNNSNQELRWIIWMQEPNFIPKFNIKNQFADILNSSNFTRDDWNHLLYSTSWFSLCFCHSTPCGRELRKEGPENHVMTTSKTASFIVWIRARTASHDGFKYITESLECQAGWISDLTSTETMRDRVNSWTATSQDWHRARHPFSSTEILQSEMIHCFSTGRLTRDVQTGGPQESWDFR